MQCHNRGHVLADSGNYKGHIKFEGLSLKVRCVTLLSGFWGASLKAVLLCRLYTVK